MFSLEQAIISLTGFVLGGGFGILLALSVIPALTFTDLNSNPSNARFFALQSTLAAQLVVPPTLPILVVAIIGVYVLALIMMVRVVSRPVLGQVLRLNEVVNALKCGPFLPSNMDLAQSW
jgi:ABC-type antimicrobial peptide transport system permease subunit